VRGDERAGGCCILHLTTTVEEEDGEEEEDRDRDVPEIAVQKLLWGPDDRKDDDADDGGLEWRNCTVPPSVTETTPPTPLTKTDRPRHPIYTCAFDMASLSP